jgi:hypothetical protein
MCIPAYGTSPVPDFSLRDKSNHSYSAKYKEKFSKPCIISITLHEDINRVYLHVETSPAEGVQKQACYS